MFKGKEISVITLGKNINVCNIQREHKKFTYVTHLNYHILNTNNSRLGLYKLLGKDVIVTRTL